MCCCCGRWKEIEPEKWIGVLGSHVFLLTQSANELRYRVINQAVITQEKVGNNLGNKTEQCFTAFLQDYFQLHFDLSGECNVWVKNDANFKRKSVNIRGLRILRQDPTETLFSFLCSSNNNISRITGMIERMCSQYGEQLLEFAGQKYYSFPSVDKLCQPGVEHKLRQLGFGYRAEYIAESARQIRSNGGDLWLHNLRQREYKEAHAELMKLPGVGRKVCKDSLNL